MVGIVIVAHSTELADAVLNLSRVMLKQQVPLTAAAGVDDPAQPFGTNAIRIKEAIESVYSDDGVVVLMDMGSAILSAETALEFLPEEKRTRVRLCEAPLVEGSFAAAVRSEGGGTLEEVIEEARAALSAKADQLEAKQERIQIKLPKAIGSKECRLTVRNRLGIHARPAARFVLAASHFQSEILVRNITKNSDTVNAKSINLITTLGIAQGHEISIRASGPDAEQALDSLTQLVESGFGESIAEEQFFPERATSTIPRSIGNAFMGIAASPGIAVGPAVPYQVFISQVPEEQAHDLEEEWERLTRAIQIVQKDICVMRSRIAQQTGASEAAIFDAYLLSLEDPALIEGARRKMYEQALCAERAWQLAVDELIQKYEEIETPYLRARRADLSDLKGQVLQLLMGCEPIPFRLPDEAVIIAADLGPSDIARLDSEKVLGICTAFGGATSHSAILARAIGIPAVVGLGTEILRITEGTEVALDGSEGRIWVNPVDVAQFKKQQRIQISNKKAMYDVVKKPAVTRDGRHIRVTANISSTVEVESALLYGADGIGVLRTEFLFLKRVEAPSEEEQFTVYRKIAKQLGKLPLVIRTLDAGGDKPLPYIAMQDEANPSLGRRGIRLCLENHDLFTAQLRAILRAGFGNEFKIMLPMISTLQEVRSAKEYLSRVKTELRKSDMRFDEAIEMGIMIEVPSAVIISDQLAPEVKFFSIGTNDLSQYVMAADRTNASVASLNDALHPAVIRMIQQTVQGGHTAGILVGICGEIAGDSTAVPVLLGLGVDELSMNPLSIPAVKRVVAQLRMEKAEEVAQEALQLDSAEGVRRMVKERFFR